MKCIDLFILSNIKILNLSQRKMFPVTILSQYNSRRSILNRIVSNNIKYLLLIYIFGNNDTSFYIVTSWYVFICPIHISLHMIQLLTVNFSSILTCEARKQYIELNVPYLKNLLPIYNFLYIGHKNEVKTLFQNSRISLSW